MEFLKTILSDETLKTLNESLGEELVNSINEKTKEFKIDVAKEKFIPKNKFDDLNNQLKDYKTQVDERDKQLKDLKEKAKGNEDLTKQIEELQSANEKQKTEYETKLVERAKHYAIDTLLMAEGAKNLKAVKATFDLDKVLFEDGKLSGLEEQVKASKETEKYLWNIDRKNDGAGFEPSKGTKGTVDEFADIRKIR